MRELHSESMNVGKSGKFQEFPGPGKLENQIPGLSRSYTNPANRAVR
jgi:hypothetical protein